MSSYSSLPTEQPTERCEQFDFLFDVLNPSVLNGLHSDAVLLMCCRILRLFTFGFLAVILVGYLTTCAGLTLVQTGYIFSWTLIGDAVVSLTFTSTADTIGRRTILLYSSILAFTTGFLFATQTNYWIILITAIIGVISPSGNEIGPFMAIEISAISQIINPTDRVRILAWYNLFGSFATAFGALFCGLFVSALNIGFKLSLPDSYQYTMYIYVTLQSLLVVGFYNLSEAVEVPDREEKAKQEQRTVNPVSLFLGLRKSKLLVIQLSCLFMIDSFAGSFVLQSLISAWFLLTYQTPTATIGFVLFCCNLVAGISALFAAKLAEIIGLIMTMVVTHVPSNVLLILVPLMPNQALAMIMIISRFSISQMDVPTRNAYVVGVVDEDERSAAGGVTNVARSVGASLGPVFATGFLSSAATSNYIFYIAGGLKLLYDFLLLISFQSTKTSEEKEQEKKDLEKLTVFKLQLGEQSNQFEKSVVSAVQMTETVALLSPKQAENEGKQAIQSL